MTVPGPRTGRADPVDQDAETLRRAIALVRALRDPALPGLVLMVGVAVAGGVILALTVFGMADAHFVPLQIPYLVSGGFGGIALIVAGTLLASVQSERRDRARAWSEIQDVIDGVSTLVHCVGRTGKDQ